MLLVSIGILFRSVLPGCSAGLIALAYLLGLKNRAYLVKIAFGLEEFTDGRGLYTAFKDHETFIHEHRFGYTAKAQGTSLAMGGFRLYGFRFYLNLLPVAGKYTGIEDSQVFYRQSHFAHKLNGRFSHRLSVEWPLAVRSE